MREVAPVWRGHRRLGGSLLERVVPVAPRVGERNAERFLCGAVPEKRNPLAGGGLDERAHSGGSAGVRQVLEEERAVSVREVAAGEARGGEIPAIVEHGAAVHRAGG